MKEVDVSTVIFTICFMCVLISLIYAVAMYNLATYKVNQITTEAKK